MVKVKIENFDSEDWQRVWMDNELIYEGHRMDLEDFATKVLGKENVQVNYGVVVQVKHPEITICPQCNSVFTPHTIEDHRALWCEGRKSGR